LKMLEYSNLVILHIYPPTKMEPTVFRNVGIKNSEAGELPRRKHTTFRTRRKFEIKKEVIRLNSSKMLTL